MIQLQKALAIFTLRVVYLIENDFSQLESTQVFERLGPEKLLIQKLGKLKQALKFDFFIVQLIRQKLIQIVRPRILVILVGIIIKLVLQDIIQRDHKVAYFVYVIAPLQPGLILNASP